MNSNTQAPGLPRPPRPALSKGTRAQAPGGC
eukprot:CAMPEP_0182573446 /NCGR_PEP_ID=MMETSP1324-20130603/20227_1 /TAXON_ID=236786 /ORGANISM="Florenciella sp., Strain RCC1587" /LENGTH=30 /DNA_ID= /DNA_START= /DNA_END= /DNA_ORIENTATION=